MAEDNLVNQKVATRFLQKLGYQCDIANNGQEAVELSSKKQYDVILMDMQMPILDGLEASLAIRKNTELHQPAIIALTAKVMNEDKQACFKCGMNDFLTKPLKLHQLSEALKKTNMNLKKNKFPPISV